MNTARAQKKATVGSKGNSSQSSLFIAPKKAKKKNKKSTEDKKAELFVVPKTESTAAPSKIKDAKNSKGKKSSSAAIQEKKPTTSGLGVTPKNTKAVVGKGKETKKVTATKGEAPKGKEAVKKEYIVIKTPSKPENDKAFQDTLKHIKGAKEAQEVHPKSDVKAAEVKAAAILPENEQQQVNNRTAHYASIETTSKEAKKKKFTAASFKESLKKELDTLEANLPTTEAGAEDFKKDKPLNAVKKNVNTNVTDEKEKVAGPLAVDAKDSNPPKSETKTTTPKGIIADSTGKAPKPINKKSATPKPKHKTEISMEKESDSLDDMMGENEITDKQLANSNEPKFTEALDSKTKAQEEAKKAPQRYRKKENIALGDAKTEAAAHGKDKLGGMFETRTNNFSDVLSAQNSNESEDKLEQKRINKEFKRIYDNTKEKVGTRLDKISTDVDAYFEEGGAVEKAKKSFEKRVEKKLSDIYGWTTIDDSIASFFSGSDVNAGAIEGVFRTEKKNFIDKLDKIFDKIAALIAKGLNESMTLIDNGRTEMNTFNSTLSTKQQELAADSLETFNDKYNDLEESVASKEQELAQDLAKQYKENVDSLRATFDEIKDRVSSSWLEAAFNFLKGIIETILKIKDLLFSLISALIDAIKAIITDPIGFLKNLFLGIKLGFEYFFANIKTHLITGLIEWLTGSLGGVGITIPDNLFSLKGIFNLVMQILGLSWDYFRSKAVRMLGEPVVEGMEKAVEVFSIIKEKGVAGLWEHIKEQFSDLKEVVMDAIRDMVITKVVEAGIKWIMGLMSPAGAFVKAAMLIIDVVRFFVERAAQIFELVTAFIDGVRALAAGGIEGLAKSIEKALAKTLPILIGFLAALVGVTGLTAKVQKIIKRIRKRIDKAINKVIKKARKAFKGLLKKGKAKVKGAVGKVLQWWKKKKKFKLKSGEKHSLYFKGKSKKPTLIMASKNPTSLVDKINGYLALKGTERTSVVKNAAALGSAKTEAIAMYKAIQALEAKPGDKKTSGGKDVIQGHLEKIKGHLINGLHGEDSLPLSNVTYEKGTDRPSKVLASPLTKNEGNTKGKNSSNRKILDGYKLVDDWVAKTGAKRDTSNALGVHILAHHIHGPWTNWNAVFGSRSLNESMKGPEKIAGDNAKTHKLDFDAKVSYYQNAKFAGTITPASTVADVKLAIGYYMAKGIKVKITKHDGAKKKVLFNKTVPGTFPEITGTPPVSIEDKIAAKLRRSKRKPLIEHDEGGVIYHATSYTSADAIAKALSKAADGVRTGVRTLLANGTLIKKDNRFYIRK